VVGAAEARAPSSGAGGEAEFESFRRAATLGLDALLVHGFGDGSVLARLDAQPEGDPLVLDLDPKGDAKALFWHEGGHRIASVDEDGDLRAEDRRPDSDSDCLLVDLAGDGVLDRAIDWIDLDRDGDADVQVLYEVMSGGLGAEGVAATIVFDLDDDDRFFHTTD
jgi:hypothetical protein